MSFPRCNLSLDNPFELPPPKNPAENGPEPIPGDPQPAHRSHLPEPGEAKRAAQTASDYDPNSLEFPPPGAILGRVIGGSPGCLRVKLAPISPNHQPTYHTYTKPSEDKNARFRRHCPVVAFMDTYKNDIDKLREDTVAHHWHHYSPIPGIISSVAPNGTIKLKAEIEDVQLRQGVTVGGYETRETTAFTNRLQAPHIPPAKTRVHFYGAITTRTHKQPGTRKHPRAERYIDIVHIEVNKDPLTKNESQTLFPPLLKHLTETFKIDIEIGTSGINENPNSFGALQNAATGKHQLLDIITHTKNQTTRANELGKHADTARKLTHAFNKSPPQLNLLIKPRKHLDHTIITINNQLHENPKLRKIISNIYLILPANPQTNHKNPYHANPHILTDIDNSFNNYAKHIHHIAQPTFEGAYDPTTKTTTYKRARNLTTYNIIQFAPLRTNKYSNENTTLPFSSLLTTPSFDNEQDDDASDIDEPAPTEYIHVSHPNKNEHREQRADQLITDIAHNYKNIHIEIIPSTIATWRSIKIEPSVSQDASTILDQLTSSDALVAAMGESDYAMKAEQCYTLIAQPGHLESASTLAVIRALGFEEAEGANKTAAPPPTRITDDNAIVMITPLSYETVIEQLNDIYTDMKGKFPFKLIHHPSHPRKIHYFAKPPTRPHEITDQKQQFTIRNIESDRIDIVIDISKHAPKASSSRTISTIKNILKHFNIPIEAQQRAQWVADRKGGRGIKINAIPPHHLSIQPFKTPKGILASISKFNPADYPLTPGNYALAKSSLLTENRMARGPHIPPSKTDISVIQLAEKFREAKVNTRTHQGARAGKKEKEKGKGKEGEGKGKAGKEQEKKGGAKEPGSNKEGKGDEEKGQKGTQSNPQRGRESGKGNNIGNKALPPKTPNNGSNHHKTAPTASGRDKPNEGGQQSINALFLQLARGGTPPPISPLGASAAHPLTILGPPPRPPLPAGGKRAVGALESTDPHAMSIDEGDGSPTNAPNSSPSKKPKK